MNLKHALFLFLLAGFVGCNSSTKVVKNETTKGYKVVEQVTRKSDELVIPYTKYKLDNGLTVLLHEDHSDPIAHVDVTYHVGSAREEIGKSGFAHFFEHMMFQGSDHVADEEHFKIVSESGGTLNGTTNRDRTNYFETVPKNQLETALWLEADRMGFLLDAVTQQKFEIQRATVKNERGQNYDNRPYGLANEEISKALYPYGHPYSWLTIGYIEDLDRVDVNDLKNFFLRWYGPNNAVLTVAGDIDQEKTINDIVKYFGSIPRGPEVEDMGTMIPELTADRYVSYKDNYAKVPRIYMVWPAPELYNEDEPALDALAEILGQGKNSIVYQNLVKTNRAQFAGTFNGTDELSGQFTMLAQVYPNQSLADIEAELRKALEEFEQKGVSDEALQRFKAGWEANFISDMRSVGSFGGKASKLARYYTFADNANFATEHLNRYMSVTKEDIMRVFNKYVKGKPAVILSVLPKEGNFSAAAPDNYTVDPSQYVAPDYGYNGLVYNKAVDSFDRSQRPKKGDNPSIIVPEYKEFELKNGVKVLQTNYNETPEVFLQLSFEGGHFLSKNNKGKAGIANVFMQMMQEGTKNYTAEEFASELEKLGSSMNPYSTTETMGVSITTLKRNLSKTIDLLEEKLFNPSFTQEDLDRIKQSQLQAIENNKTNPSYIASVAYDKVLYGNDDIRAIPTIGTKESIESLTLQDVRDFYTNLSPKVLSVVVVGDVAEAKLKDELSFLANWDGKDIEIPTFEQPKPINRSVLYVVDVDGAAQSQIRIGYPLDIPYDATGEFYRLGLMNYPLGGAFNSRINLNLREDKGWSYGARSGFRGSKIPGEYIASAGVKKEATDSSVVEFMKEITGFYQDGISPEEMTFMKNSISQAEAREYETPYQKLSLLSRIMRYDLPKGYISKQNQILEAISQDEINGLAKKYLDPEKMIIVAVGDKKEILPSLKKLGYPIVELDAQGNKQSSN